MEDDWATLIASERHARIRGALDEFRADDGLYLDPDIPPKKLTNARSTSGIPATERVFGLLDCTVFGSAKNAIVFGETALYYHNSWSVSTDTYRGRHTLGYDQLAKLEVTKTWSEIRFPGGAIEISGSSFSADKVLQLFRKLQQYVREGGGPKTSALEGTAIAPHQIVHDTLVPTNLYWPSGIGTNADASIVAPPLERAWGLEIDGEIVAAPVIARDFVILGVRGGVFRGAQTRLIGLELTTGRRYWERFLPLVHWSGLVATQTQILRRGGALWHGFDLETGETQAIDVRSLSRGVRDQLVLADADIHDPASYCSFASELAYPDPLVDLPLLCANNAHRIYARAGLSDLAPALQIVDARGEREVRGNRRSELEGHALADRFLFVGLSDKTLHAIDCETSAIVSSIDLPIEPMYVSIGSDHLVVAAESHVRVYRGR